MDTFSSYLENHKEFGVVEQINHPLVIVSGFPHIQPSEMVLFETGEIGEVFSISRESVDILVFSAHPVAVGTKVVRSKKHISIPLSDQVLGSIINPLGVSISTSSVASTGKEYLLDGDIPPLSQRKRIDSPFLTGVAVIDMMVPLGKGQKQLVIGDRKTGKTSFLLSTVKKQALDGTIVVYAAVGKKKNDIKKLEQFFKKENIMDKVVLVATSSYDPASLVVLTPFAAMSIAEYFKSQGRDTLVVLDDLSTHAQFYREISLLGKRFPGRESYPGDIFYLHSRLLERAGNFVDAKKGSVSITCFPVAETVEGDFTSYINTNLMGMTDGHIYFDSNLFYQGRRPAVNIQLSVTRVGKQVQEKVRLAINREVTAFLTLYEKMQSFSHFGAELSTSIKLILRTGDRIYKFFNQHYSFTVPIAVQLVLFSMLWLKFLEEESDSVIEEYKRNLAANYFSNPSVAILLNEMVAKAVSFNDLLSKVTPAKDQLLQLCRTKS